MPEAELATSCTGSDPVHTWMELCDGWNSCDAIPPKLCKLLSLASVDIDKAVHVSNAETLYTILWHLLPLSSQSRLGQYTRIQYKYTIKLTW